jgi:hypothetical protein
MNSSILKQPSVFIPMVLSLLALAIVLTHIAVPKGSIREADEGTAAHLWQLFMAAQVPVMAFFAAKWLPQTPRRALPILVLQAFAALAAFAPVFLPKL